jgi:hypothetical protein
MRLGFDPIRDGRSPKAGSLELRGGDNAERLQDGDHLIMQVEMVDREGAGAYRRSHQRHIDAGPSLRHQFVANSTTHGNVSTGC